jgi:hypothetical protein
MHRPFGPLTPALDSMGAALRLKMAGLHGRSQSAGDAEEPMETPYVAFSPDGSPTAMASHPSQMRPLRSTSLPPDLDYAGHSLGFGRRASDSFLVRPRVLLWRWSWKSSTLSFTVVMSKAGSHVLSC